MSLFLILVLGVAGIAICMSIYAVTVITAAIVGSNVAREGFSWCLRTGLDATAGVGLALLVVAAVLPFGLESSSGADVATCVLIGLLLSPAASTSRHVKLYRELSDRAYAASANLARSLRRLGMTRAIFERLSLSACAAIILVMISSDGRGDSSPLGFNLASLIGCRQNLVL